jgi:uncharacterized membrane protein YgaE (UPF0421/DUF939 family)
MLVENYYMYSLPEVQKELTKLTTQVEQLTWNLHSSAEKYLFTDDPIDKKFYRNLKDKLGTAIKEYEFYRDIETSLLSKDHKGNPLSDFQKRQLPKTVRSPKSLEEMLEAAGKIL